MAANSKYTVFAINQTSNAISPTLYLGNTSTSGNYVQMSFPGITTPTYALSMNANSTMVLVFNYAGDLIKKVEYKLSDGSFGKPVYTHNAPNVGNNYIVMTELGNDQLPCCGGVTLTSLPSIPSATYTWYSSASNFTTSLQSSTSNTFSIPLGSATYKCLVSYNGQTAFDYVKASAAGGSGSCCKITGIVEAVNSEENNLYTVPNPTNDKTTIFYILPSNIKNAVIQITDISGKLIQAMPVSHENESIELDCSPYANGIYLYSLKANDKIISTKKLVIAK